MFTRRRKVRAWMLKEFWAENLSVTDLLRHARGCLREDLEFRQIKDDSRGDQWAFHNHILHRQSGKILKDLEFSRAYASDDYERTMLAIANLDD